MSLWPSCTLFNHVCACHWESTCKCTAGHLETLQQHLSISFTSAKTGSLLKDGNFACIRKLASWYNCMCSRCQMQFLDDNRLQHIWHYTKLAKAWKTKATRTKHTAMLIWLQHQRHINMVVLHRQHKWDSRPFNAEMSYRVHICLSCKPAYLSAHKKEVHLLYCTWHTTGSLKTAELKPITFLLWVQQQISRHSSFTQHSTPLCYNQEKLWSHFAVHWTTKLPPVARVAWLHWCSH